MGKIFTYGCSFTNYVWPTWADLLLHKNDGHNLGNIGAGAIQMMHRIVDTDGKYDFKNNDLVIAIFPTLYRWDYVFSKESKWSNDGLIINKNEFHELNNNFFTLESLAHNNMNAMILTKNFLVNNKINHLVGCIENIFENTFDSFPLDHFNKIDYVKKNINFDLKSFNRFIYGDRLTTKWEITKTFNDTFDYHPRPITHYKWLKEILLPKIDGYQLKITEDEVMEMERKIDTFGSVKDCYTYFEKSTDYFKNRISSKIYFEINETPKKNKLI
jgi:hypothetical protein